MQLLLPGASDKQLAAGVEAARSFLEEEGLTPEECMAAFALMEAWDDAGALPEDAPAEDVVRAARFWIEAQVVAVSTASDDWPFDVRTGELHA